MSQTKRVEMVKREVVTATTCDACGKVAGPSPDGWHHFSSSHSDWGNDSVDSFEYHDACSFACYIAEVREIVNDYGDGHTLEVDDKDIEFLLDMLAASVSTRVST